MRGKATRGATIAFGDFGLKAMEPGWITQRQIEASRVALTRMMKREGKVWIRIFPDKPVTKKPAETRMGSGKGNPEFWVVVIKPGRVMFEIGGVKKEMAKGSVDACRAQAADQNKVRYPNRLRCSFIEYTTTMKTFEIKDLSDSELVKRIADDKESLAHMKFQQATKQIENTAKLRLIRRDIARMMTMLNQRKRKAAATKP